MMNSEQKLTCNEAARLAPGKPHPSAVWRWCRKGVRTRSGGRIRLEHIRVGGRLFTSREALDRFFVAVAAADVGYFDTPKHAARPPRKGDRTAEIEAAERKLSADGI